MNKTDAIKPAIENQIKENILMNIFYDYDQIELNQTLYEYVKNTQLSPKQEKEIIDYTINSLFYLLYKYNQYIHFDEASHKIIFEIYSDLLRAIKSNIPKEEVEKNHIQKVKDFLISTNPFLLDISTEGIKTFTNQEYTAKFQLNLFQIDVSKLSIPILDIGCGEHHHLVTYLREQGLESYGLDRYDSKYPYVLNEDYIHYPYPENTYGTIISNMAFSNHFNKHLLFRDNKVKPFCHAYYQILNSLRVNGVFHYAPSIFEIETTLNKRQYEVTYQEISYGIYATKVKRLF